MTVTLELTELVATVTCIVTSHAGVFVLKSQTVVCRPVARPWTQCLQWLHVCSHVCMLYYIRTVCVCVCSIYIFFFCGVATQRGSWPPHSWGFLDHTQWRTTVGRTPLDEWSARRRDLYLTTHNTHNRQTSMPPMGFEPTISTGEWPQTYALDRAATGTGYVYTHILCMHKRKKDPRQGHIKNTLTV